MLYVCPKCQKLVSDQETSCPNCGCSMDAIIASSFKQDEPVQSKYVPLVPEKKKDSTLIGSFWGFGLFGLILLAAVLSVGKSGNNKKADDKIKEATEITTDKGSDFTSDQENSINDTSSDGNQTMDGSVEMNDVTFERPPYNIKDETGDAAGLENASLEEKNAVKQAESYLNHLAFSREGLIDQLTSEYGSNYSASAAEYAIKYLEDNKLVDWKEQAIQQARSYLEHSPFSRAGLIEQLSSKYGSQFTREEAEYAIKQLEDKGLVDWKEQAIQQARSYLEHSPFSRAGLIEQLSSEYGSKFTREEAEYAIKQLEDKGLVDWKEQAVLQAASYLKYSSFSKEDLINQLSSEYGSQFTREEAEYAVKKVGY